MRLRPAGIALVSIFLVLTASAAKAEDWMHVRWVDDGDTVVLADGRRVRYIGINAPEVAHEAHGKKAEPLGNEARDFNRRLVHRKQVRLELDEEKFDPYDRLLAYVFLPGQQMVNVQMVAAGYAYLLPHWPNRRYESLLLGAQREAMQAQRGIWRLWNSAHGKRVGNRRSRRFHAAACPSSPKISPRNRIDFDSAWEAFWQGFAPAKQCLPNK